MGKKFIILILAVLFVVLGCGEKAPDSDTSELFLLDESGSFSVWWDGTPGAKGIQYNISSDVEVIEMFFLVKNNSDKKINLELSCKNIEEVEFEETKLNLKPEQMKKLYVSFPVSSLLTEKLILGQEGPEISIQDKLSEEEIILRSCIQKNDPDLLVEWEKTEPLIDLDYSEIIKNHVKITNISEITKEIYMYSPQKLSGDYTQDKTYITLEPGEDITHEYDVYYVKYIHKGNKDSFDSHTLILESDGYFFSNQIFTRLSDCQDWEFKWLDSPDIDALKMDITDFESFSLDIEIINPCDRERVFKPEKQYVRSILARFENEEYKIPANSSVKTKLNISIAGSDIQINKKSVIEFNFLKEYGHRNRQDFSLTLDYRPKLIGKPEHATNFILPENKYWWSKTHYKVIDNIILLSGFSRVVGIYPPSQKNLDSQISCFDLNSGSLLWTFSDDTIKNALWYEVFGESLYLLGSVGGSYNDTQQKLYSIDMSSGQVNFETETFPIAKRIAMHDKKTLIFENFDYWDGKHSFFKVNMETGELESGKVEPKELQTPTGAFNYKINNFDKKTSIVKSDGTGSTIWETPLDHDFGFIIDYSLKATSHKNSYWFYQVEISDDELRSYEGSFSKLDDSEKIYYLFVDNDPNEYCCESNGISFDGIGCINKENGEILWETEVSLHWSSFDGIVGCPSVSFFGNCFVISHKKYSRKDGKMIGQLDEASKEENYPNEWKSFREHSGYDGIKIEKTNIFLDDNNIQTYVRYCKGEDEPFFSTIFTSSDNNRNIYLKEKDLLVIFTNDKTLFVEVPK